jgi:hypothetical protein
LPLRYFEDDDLAVDGDRGTWLESWHSEREWLNAVHRTRYSNAIIGLAEHFSPVVIGESALLWAGAGDDAVPLHRFAARLRRMAAADLLVLANYYWNFNVRGFNPGGNHGSFFRISTHSVLMLSGKGVAPGIQIEQPYDSLSFVPTLNAMLGLPASGYPGPVISELVKHE